MFFCTVAFGCRVGLGVCYDIRFAEMAQIYSRKGKTALMHKWNESE